MLIKAHCAIIRRRRTVLETAKCWELMIWHTASDHVDRLVFWRETRAELIALVEVFT